MYKVFAYLIIFLLLAGCASTTKAPASTLTDTPTTLLTSASTTPPTPTPTKTPSPTKTPTLIPWQSYKMTYLITIGWVGKLFMPVPREWDGIGMSNITILEISPEPDDIYQDNQGNTIAYWNVGNQGVKDYSITFLVSLAPIKYSINSDNIGEFDTLTDEYLRYTQPSTRIESENEEIILLARQITGIETNPYRQAQLVHKWVSTNISGPGEDGETAFSTLENRNGSCGGHSFLFVALLRALGIPARAVSGLHTGYSGTFNDGSFWDRTLYTHVWSEFYLPNYGWIQSDTSGGLNNFAEINEPRIILSRGEDIELGPEFPSNSVPWFHIPHVDSLINAGDPKTQWAGDSLNLQVERVP